MKEGPISFIKALWDIGGTASTWVVLVALKFAPKGNGHPSIIGAHTKGKNLLSKELNKTNYITVAIMFLQLAKNCSIIAF